MEADMHQSAHAEDITQPGNVAEAASWPSSYYDVGRSVYWYLCTHHLAYFIQSYAPQGKLNSMLDLQSNHGEMHECQENPLCICEQSLSMAPCSYEKYEKDASAASAQMCPKDENGPLLPSGWVEDFLIDCYLGGSFTTPESNVSKQEELCMDNGMRKEPTLCDSYGIEVETPSDTQTLDCDDNTLCSKEVQQDNEDDCVHKSEEKGGGFEEATDEDKSLLEAWQAQYGQVVRSKVEAQLCPQAVNLWNWNTFVLKGKCRHESCVCLRGQLARTPSRFHPYSQHRNGFIKTACICEVNLDLVKVSSGEIYRLRQPSLKYLSSVAVYDSSNPTKNWNFPCFSFSGLEDVEGHAECVSSAASKLSLVAKPFVPNLNHQRYQLPSKRKIAPPAMPASLRALSRKEIASIEERKQNYRDRAKERREIHGINAEHAMHHDKQELCSVAGDVNNEWEKGSKRPLTAQHMLERMGWCEGEGLGKRKDGLKEPLNEMSNRGRAGIGWFPHSSLLNKKRSGH